MKILPTTNTKPDDFLLDYIPPDTSLCPIVRVLPNVFSLYLDKGLIMSGTVENSVSSEPSSCHPLQN